MQGAVKSGSSPSEVVGATAAAADDLGYGLFSKTITLQAATAASVDGSIPLPVGAQIVDFRIDSTVAWTATTASLTIGLTAGGTDFVTGMDVKTITRGPTAAFTAAQLGAMQALASGSSTLAVRVASTGANATGTTKVTVVYTPKL
jgi:hypothetical protein